MIDNDIIEVLRRKFTRLASELDERGRRRWAASEALELGHGGIKAVAQATGLGERTVRRGCQEVRHPPQGHLVFQYNPDESQRLYWLGRQLAASRCNVGMPRPPQQANGGVA